uniref:Uncharacterized protein n=1 Tax=Tanacetum cinerariifolium TaxID=118510 RepID=A0A699JUD5_TANCI|nr:hypothetical protein [Tanacetum cinerariifolium]
MKGFKFKIRRTFFERCFDFIISVDGDFLEWGFFAVGLRFRIFIGSHSMNLSNSAKISSSRRCEEKVIQDEGNFAGFFHFKNNEISRKDRKVCHRCWVGSYLDGNHSVRLNANYLDSSLRRDYDHGSFKAFPSYEAKHRNSDCRTGSRSDNMVGSPHEIIIHLIVILKNIKKVTEVIDVKN